MLNNLLNLDGITVLDKKQQSKVSGGQVCKFNVNGKWMKSPVKFSEGEAGSREARDLCIAYIEQNFSADEDNPTGRCRYDCDYDGFGQ